LIFSILCINKLGFKLSGGEEQYLAMAKQFMYPSWIPNSFTLTEFAGTRIVFQFFVGLALKWADFEVVAFFARLINYALISIPLAMLYKRLRFGYVLVFISFQLFVMSDQSLLGLEWMFNTFEPKTVAYIFLFYALNKVLDKQYSQAAIFLALSTHFHILVGGWFLVALVLHLLLLKRIREGFRLILIYGLLCLPFAVYLFYGYFLDPPPDTDVNLDWVYVYFRLPHHLGIFKSSGYFMEHHFVGVILTALALGAGLWLFKKQTDSKLRMVNSLMLIMFGINLFFVLVAWVDHKLLDSSGGLMLKYYPFRTNSLATFILFILLLNKAENYLSGRSFYKPVKQSVVGVFMLLTIVQGVNNVKRNLNFPEDVAFDEMAFHIKKHTDKKAVFMLTDIRHNSDLYSSFGRKAERENFVVYKFVAAEKDKLLEWYKKYNVLSTISGDINRLPEFLEDYEIDYVLSRKEYNHVQLKPEYNNSTYYLYKVNAAVLN